MSETKQPWHKQHKAKELEVIRNVPKIPPNSTTLGRQEQRKLCLQSQPDSVSHLSLFCTGLVQPPLFPSIPSSCCRQRFFGSSLESKEAPKMAPSDFRLRTRHQRTHGARMGDLRESLSTNYEAPFQWKGQHLYTWATITILPHLQITKPIPNPRSAQGNKKAHSSKSK